MRSRLTLLTLLLFLFCLPVGAQEAFKDDVFDFQALTATPLNPRVLKTSEQNGITTEEVMFHSETDDGKDVEIFAFFCYPTGGKNLPAFVWNQAGLGQASTYFPELGARRGYAALSIDMPMPGYRSTGGYPISLDFKATDEPRQHPIYHGAVALLKAVSFLQSRPEVDANRIGMAGSSWGGFFSTLMAGVDPRLKAVSAMFGTGNMQLGSAWWDGNGKTALYDAALRERWRTTLDPAFRLPHSKAAIAWFSGTNDHFYWMPSLMKTYDMAAGAKHLSLLPNWNHGLTPTLDDQVFTWLDIYLQGKPEFLKVTPVEVKAEGTKLWAQWRVSGPRRLASAHLIFSPGEAGNWESRPWMTLPAQIKDGLCRVQLSPNALPYFISGTVVDSDGYYSSTPLLRVQPSQPATRLAYDGAASWGNFEKDDLHFLSALGFAQLTGSPDARNGLQSIVLPQGRTSLQPLYYVPGVAHRLTVYLKAAQATPVSIELSGSFDGKPLAVKKDVTATATWTAVTLDYTPPPSLAGTLGVTFTVPEGASALADTLSFRPR